MKTIKVLALIVAFFPALAGAELLRGRVVSVYDGELDRLVAADGFARRMDMRDFFDRHYGLPFRGWLSTW